MDEFLVLVVLDDSRILGIGLDGGDGSEGGLDSGLHRVVWVKGCN